MIPRRHRGVEPLAQAEAGDGKGCLDIMNSVKQGFPFATKQRRAAKYLNKNRPSQPFPRPGVDGPLGVAELIMGYLYGGAPGGDHPDMPLFSLRMCQGQVGKRQSVPLPPGASSDVMVSVLQRTNFAAVTRKDFHSL